MKKILIVAGAVGLCIGNAFGSSTAVLESESGLDKFRNQRMILHLKGGDIETDAYNTINKGPNNDCYTQDKALKNHKLSFGTEGENSDKTGIAVTSQTKNNFEKKCVYDTPRIEEANSNSCAVALNGTDVLSTNLQGKHIARANEGKIITYEEKALGNRIKEQADVEDVFNYLNKRIDTDKANSKKLVFKRNSNNVDVLSANSLGDYGIQDDRGEIIGYEEKALENQTKKNAFQTSELKLDDLADKGVCAIEGTFHFSRAALGATLLTGSALLTSGCYALKLAPFFVPWIRISTFHNKFFNFLGAKLVRMFVPLSFIDSAKSIKDGIFFIGNNIPLSKGKFSTAIYKIPFVGDPYAYAGWLGTIVANCFFSPVINFTRDISQYGIKFGGKQMMKGLRGLEELGQYYQHRYNSKHIDAQEKQKQ